MSHIPLYIRESKVYQQIISETEEAMLMKITIIKIMIVNKKNKNNIFT
jgi:hypothetical protein